MKTYEYTAGFKYFHFDAPACISVRVRGTGSGVMKVYSDLRGEPAASVPIQASSDWQTFTGELVSITGTSALYFRYEGSEYVDFDSFEFTAR